MTPLIIALVAVVGFLAAVVDSSVGGGGLIRLPMLLAVGVPPHLALGTNKFGASAASTVSSFLYRKSVQPKLAALGFALAFAASVLGVLAVSRVDQALLRPMILVVLAGVLAYTLLRPEMGRDHNPRSGRRVWVAIVLLALGLGFYDGFLGPGVGTFLIVGIVQFLGYNLTKAAALGRFLNWGSNLGALLTFAIVGLVDYQIGVPLAIANVAGAIVGTRLTLSHGAKFLRPLLIVATSAVLLKLLWDLLTS